MNRYEIKKEIEYILSYLSHNSFWMNKKDVMNLYRRYLYLESRVSTNSPSFKDDKDMYKCGNCYCYALGFKTPNIFNDVFVKFDDKMIGHNIGFVSDTVIDISNSRDLMFGFENDMSYLGIKYYDSEILKPNIHNGYKVSLYRGFEDFHFTRQNKDGSWSHKIGYEPIVIKCSDPADVLDYEIIHTYEVVKPVVRRLI